MVIGRGREMAFQQDRYIISFLSERKSLAVLLWAQMPITSVMAACQVENGHFTHGGELETVPNGLLNAQERCNNGVLYGKFTFGIQLKEVLAWVSFTFSFILGMLCSTQTLPGGFKVTFGLINPLLVTQPLPYNCQSNTFGLNCKCGLETVMLENWIKHGSNLTSLWHE